MAKYRSELPKLDSIPTDRFENIFKMYTENKYYFYNILKTLNIPEELDESLFFNFEVPNTMAWHILSYKLYRSTDLWWLIAVINDIKNPVILPQGGDILKVIQQGRINEVLSLINSQL